MGFEINYTPFAAIGQAAHQVGVGSYRMAVAEMRQRERMQERALQANMQSQAMAHQNALERMGIEGQFDRERDERQVGQQQRMFDLQRRGVLQDRHIEQAWEREKLATETENNQQHEARNYFNAITTLERQDAERRNLGYSADPKQQAAWQTQLELIDKDENLDAIRRAQAKWQHWMLRPPVNVPPPASFKDQMEGQMATLNGPEGQTASFYPGGPNGAPKQIEWDKPPGSAAAGGSGAKASGSKAGATGYWAEYLGGLGDKAPKTPKEAAIALQGNAAALQSLRKEAFDSLGDGGSGENAVGPPDETKVRARMKDIVNNFMTFGNEDIQSAADKFYEAVGGKEKVSSSYLPLPKNKEQAVKGQVYGPAKGQDGELYYFGWDGKSFHRLKPFDVQGLEPAPRTWMRAAGDAVLAAGEAGGSLVRAVGGVAETVAGGIGAVKDTMVSGAEAVGDIVAGDLITDYGKGGRVIPDFDYSSNW